MASCQNLVGVRNLVLGFVDCSSNVVGSAGTIKSRTHAMAKDELPMYMMVNYTNEGTSNGRVKRTYENCKVEIKVSRDISIPLQYYQGRASIDYQCEHLSGAVVTGLSGFVTGVETSDGDEVSMTIEFIRLEELLPSGAIIQL